MSDTHGGYRRPRNPAPVSGPGRLSARTDGNPGTTPVQAARYIQGSEYGESKELNGFAAAAPLAQAEGTPIPQAVPEGADFPAVQQYSDVTQYPDQPIVAGSGSVVPEGIDPAEFADSVRLAYVADPGVGTLRMLLAVEAEGL